MKRCETCVHWEPPGEFDQRRNDGRGRCLKIIHEEQSPSGALAAVMDFEGYQASLRVQASFGCVLWESRVLRESTEWPYDD